MAYSSIFRHPDYPETPHFRVVFDNNEIRIVRVDTDNEPLTLLRNEHGLTTYTFEMSRRDLKQYLTDYESNNKYIDKLFGMTIQTKGTQEDNIFTSQLPYRIDDIRFVNSVTGESTGVAYDKTSNSPTYTTPSIDEYDIICFSYTFSSVHMYNAGSELEFKLRLYTSGMLYVSTSPYSEKIAILDSQNLCNNPHSNLKVVRHPDYKDVPHFYIDTARRAWVTTTVPIFLDKESDNGITFTASSNPIVTFQIKRAMWDGSDLYNLTDIRIKSKIGDLSFNTIIKSSDGIDNVVYVSSSDSTKWVTKPEVAPDPSVYDTICFTWDMSSCAPIPGIISFTVEGFKNSVSKFHTDEYCDIEHRSIIAIENGKVYHPDYPSAPHFSIDSVTRTVRLMTDDIVSLNSSDSGGARLTFQVSRMLDDTKDLYDATAIHIFYANTSATDSQDRYTGSHTCKQISSVNGVTSYGIDDLAYVNSRTGEVFRVRYDSTTGKYTKPPSEFDVMCFSWVISHEATTKAGYLAFAIRFAKTTPEKYVWNSGMYTDIVVGESLDLGFSYADEIDDRLSLFYEQFEIALSNTEECYVVPLLEKATADIEGMVDSYKEQLDTFKNEFDMDAIQSFAVSDTEPSDPRVAVWINPDDAEQQVEIFLEPTDIAQVLTDSEDKVPSLKLLKTEINDVNDRLNDLANNFAKPTEEAVGNYLDKHRNLITNLGDKGVAENHLTDELKLKTIHNYVTPQMYGAYCDGAHDDSEAIQKACMTGLPVVIDKDVTIGKTVYVYNSVTIKEDVTVTIVEDVVGFKMGDINGKTVVIDDTEHVIECDKRNQMIAGSGLILVDKNLTEYSNSVIEIIDGYYAKVSSISIETYKYYYRVGTAIKIACEKGKCGFCRVVDTNIRGFKYGIHLFSPEGVDTKTVWNNNHDISSQTSYCANSVRVERSNNHRVKIYGQSGQHPLFDASIVNEDGSTGKFIAATALKDKTIYDENPDGTEIYVLDSSLNLFDINLVDTGNFEQNKYSIQFIGGADNIVTGAVYYHRIKGKCKTVSIADSTAIHPVPGMYDLFANIPYIAPRSSYSGTDEEYENELTTHYTVESINNATLKNDTCTALFTYPRNSKPSRNTLQYEVGADAGNHTADSQGCELRIPVSRASILAFSIQESAYPNKMEIQVICSDRETDYVEVNLNAENLIIMSNYFSDKDILDMVGLRIRLTGATSRNKSGNGKLVVVHSISAIGRDRYDHPHKEYSGIYRNGDIMSGDLRFVPETGPVIISPNGTKFRLSVSDDGVLSVANIGAYAPEGGDYR